MNQTTREKIMRTRLLPALLIIILILTLASATLTLGEDQQQKLLYISVEKPYYNTGEKVTLIITPDNLQDYSLSIKSESNLYKYSGELTSSIDFYPKEKGMHTAELTFIPENIVGDSLSFVVGAPENTQNNDDEIGNETNTSVEEGAETPGTETGIVTEPNLIITDKSKYAVGETVSAKVNILVSNQENYKLYYEYGDFSQRYMGNYASISFMPRGIGKHYLVLKDLNNAEIERAGFEVVDNTEDISSLPLTPSEPSPTCIETDVNAKNTFEDTSKKILKLINSKGIYKRAIMRIYDAQNQEINTSAGMGLALNSITAQTAEIIPEDGAFNKLVLRNLALDYQNNFDLGIDELASSQIKIGRKNTLKAFAIDASSLSFTTGTLTGTAKGTELWKCKEWEFLTQTCLGTWQKIMDLMPGQDYEIEISPEDPGYAETGIASINTKKPIYHPGETPAIIIVVLDTEGHLVSNVNINLQITSPENQTTLMTTDDGSVIETETGIYEAVYPAESTTAEGNYSLLITATGDNVNSTMYSYFTIRSYYEFDIIRNTPVTTDPWNGTFESSITIISYINTTNATNSTSFNFTEMLPESFGIISASGAIITSSNNKTYLTWTNLESNSVVSYSAIPPFITPELYELGPSFVSYEEKNNNSNNSSNIFYEARQWYLAVDPISISSDLESGTITYGGSNDVVFFYDSADSISATYWDNTNDGDWSASSTNACNGTSFRDASSGTSYLISKTAGINTTGYAGITFRFTPHVNNLDGGEELNADWYDGSTWTNVYTRSSDIACGSQQSLSLTSSANNNTNFQMRFVCDHNAGSGERCIVDDVRLLGTAIETEVNKTATNYSNITLDSVTSPLVNITVTVYISAYNTSASTTNGNNNASLGVSLYNGSSWIFIGKMNITGTGNFSISTTDSTILTAWETQSNRNMSINGIYIDYKNSTKYDQINYTGVYVSAKYSVAPTVNINTSLDETYASSTQLSIGFNFTSDDSSTASCTLYIDDVAYGTNSSTINNTWTEIITNNSLSEANHSVYVNCTGTLGKIGKSTTVHIILDTTAPVVNAISPDNGNSTSNNPPNFYFNYTDSISSTASCTLFINSTMYGINSSVINNTQTNITANATLTEGHYNWNVTCTDQAGNSAGSTSRSLTIKVGPTISNAAASPNRTGIGQQVTISADINDSNGVSSARVIITKPDSQNVTATMTNISASTYQYNYTPWTPGTYKFSIVANDTEGTESTLDPYFYVYANSDVLVLTEKDSYVNNENVNLIPGFVNWSSDQESSTQQVKAQGLRSTTLNATGHSFISTGEGYSSSDGAYNDTWRDDNTDYISLTRGNTGGWGGPEDDLQGYINLTYNISSLGVSSDKVNALSFLINFCHTDDITAPITCAGATEGTANNPANFDLYSFTSSTWSTRSTFTQDDTSATEQNQSFTVSTSPSSYINDHIIYSRYEVDVAMGVGEGGSFAIDYANITVNYTKLDSEGSSEYINYTSIGGSNLSNLTAFDIIITVSYYNASGSLQAGNNLPDLQATAYDGSSYTTIGSCSLNGSMANASTTATNCTLTVTSSSIITAWKNNTANRVIQVRGINFDDENSMADEINFTSVYIKYFSGSLVINHNDYNLSGYLVMTVENNNTGSYTQFSTVINDTNGGSARNISANSILDMGSIWNISSSLFNTAYYDPGSYRVKAMLTNATGSILNNSDGDPIIGYKTFALDYLKINVTAPTNNSIQDAEGFNINATLSYYNYAPGGMCQYSVDGGSNTTMQAINSTYYHNISGVLSLGSHNITVYCNDSRSYWFSSPTYYFTTTDQRGPNITLINPPDDSTEPDGNITFQYNVTDISSGVANCSLILDYITVINTTYNVTEGSTITINVTGLSYDPHVWYVKCYDNSTNYNMGNTSVYSFLVGTDTTPPEIGLIEPEPDYSSTYPDVNFSYTVSDTQSDIANCSLIINESINDTDYEIEIGESATNRFNFSFPTGDYNWSINCTDIRGNTGASESRLLHVLNDTDYPIIRLIEPADDSIDTDGDVTFSYNVSDTSAGISNCSLIINGNINQTNSSIIEDTTLYFYLYDLSDGTRINWSVNCTDNSANHNKNQSEIRQLNITIVSTMAVLVTKDKGEYQAGEQAQINTTVKDTLGNNLVADVITDIITGNATMPWWDTSWLMRKPIILSSTTNLTNVLVEVNVTGLDGDISSCANEIRIVKNDSSNNLVSINRTIESGDDANYCVVRFRANITAGVNNTQHYAYYDNPAASDPANNETRLNLTSLKVADGGSLMDSGDYDEDYGSYLNTTANDDTGYYAMGWSAGGGWGGGSATLEAYINLTYNISDDIEEANLLSFNFSINYCHTNDVTDPITCNGDPEGTANNPVNAELYNFNSSSWDAIGNFNQDDATDTEYSSTFANSLTMSSYVSSDNKIWVRYETHFTLANNEEAVFAIDYATINISYREKVYSTLSTIGSTQEWIARQEQDSITNGLVSFSFNTSSYSAGIHSAVSMANKTSYYNNFNHTFFTVIIDTSAPALYLMSPPDDNYSIVRDINFTYNVTDVGHSIANCSLIINGNINSTNSSVSEGVLQYFQVIGLSDGQYNWSINCTDTLGYTNASATRNLTIGGDVFAPSIALYSPSNNTIFLTGSSILFNYTANDTHNALRNCSLIINGTIFNTTSSPPESTVLNFTVEGLGDGNYSWGINCTDDSSNSNIGSSETRNFTIGPDTAGPVINLKSPTNGGQADNGNVTFTYNVSDWLSGISNCTIYVYDSSLILVNNTTNTTITENANQYFSVYGLSDGLYYWNISCWDNASTPNQNNSATWNFTIASDTTDPIVHLISPPNLYQDVDGAVVFYYNVSENVTSIANCSLIFNNSINTTINGSNITNGETNNFTFESLPTGNYTWYVNCSDTAQLGSNVGKSAETWILIVAPDTAGPTVTLFNPPNATQDSDGEVTFEFNTSDYASNITNCSFIFNNSINYTWDTVEEGTHYNITLPGIPNGNYSWYVNCTDDSISYNIGQSEVRNLTIGMDVTPPIVTPISPLDNEKDGDGNITFIYDVSDYASNITNCSLIINGNINQTNDTITEDTPQYFYLYNLNDTQLYWSINCTDDSPNPNTGTTGSRNLTVVLPKPLVTQVVTDKLNYVQGETVQATANSTDSTGSLMDTSMYIDIVKGNGKAPWWSTSWHYRIPVDINTTGYERNYYLIEDDINFTDILVNQLNITGKTLDTNSIRVVEWEADNDSIEKPSIFVQSDGFNATTNAVGKVSWILDGVTSLGTVRNFYVYFDVTDYSKSAASYTGHNYTFVGSGESVSYDGSSTSADYVIISSGDESFALQFSDGRDLTNQQHIQKQGAGAIWNITVSNAILTNQYSAIVLASVAANDSFTTDSTSTVISGPITRINIPGSINSVSPSSTNTNYTIWFGDSEIFVRANLSAYFGSSENNIYAYENTWFSYLFSNESSWSDTINFMQSPNKNQTHDYQGMQENTYNTFYSGEWYTESYSGLGSIMLFIDEFTVNGAGATKGIVTFDDDNDANGEGDMVGFSNNGNPDITAGDNYSMQVWMVFTSQTGSDRIISFMDEINNPVTLANGRGEQFLNRSSGTTTGGFYYYNYSTSGLSIGNYSAISWAYQTDFVNASDYYWFNITPDTIAPTVTLVRPEGWLNYDDVNFTFYISESGSGIQNCSLYINGVYNHSKTGSQVTDNANNTFNLTNMTQGSYNWTVMCYDNGNNMGTDDVLNITIDTTAPIINITIPGNNTLLNDSTPLINFTITDSLADPLNYTVYVNNAANGQNGTTANATPKLLNISTLSDGNYTLTIKGTDIANNSANATVNITIDATPPTINYTTPTPNDNHVQSDTSFTINVTHYDAHPGKIVLYWQGTANQTLDYPGTYTNFTITGLSDGIYTYYVWLNDSTGLSNQTTNRTIRIDLLNPVINLEAPDNGATLNSSVVEFNFNITDSSQYANCSLYINGTYNKTRNNLPTNTPAQYFAQQFNDGTYNWFVNCTDQIGRSNVSETRNFTVASVKPNWTNIWYETSTSNWAEETANIDLANARDGTTNSVNVTIPSGTMYNVANATTPFLAGNGVLIPAGTDVNFSGRFMASSYDLAGIVGAVTWKIYLTNESGDYLITSVGDDSNGRAPGNTNIITSAGAPLTLTGTNTTTQNWFLSPTDRLKLVVDVYNEDEDQWYTHSWDDRSDSWVIFEKFYVIGDIETDLIYPTGTTELGLGETGNMTCFVNCTYGTCINTYVYAQYNSSAPSAISWTNINTTGNIILAAGQSNPQSLGNMTAGTTNVTFLMNGSSPSTNLIRCYAVTDYNEYYGPTMQTVIVNDTTPPNVTLLSPETNSTFNITDITFYFNVTENVGIANCSLYLNEEFNATKSTAEITVNVSNNFTVTNIPEGEYDWKIVCIDLAANQGNSSTGIVYIDRTPPIINLTYPGEGYNSTSTTIKLNFTVTDNIDQYLTCNLTIDGIINRSNFLAENNTETNTSMIGLTEGAHYWNVTCWDNANHTNTSETRSFNVYIAPVINLTKPADDNLSNNPTQTFYFNVSDDTGIENCTIYLNGVANNSKSGADITNHAENNITVEGLDGRYYWNITCYDNTSYHTIGYSETWNITIDLYPPAPNITTANYSWFNTATPNISFIITDNFDSNLSYTMYVNSSANVSGTAANNTQSSTNLHDLNANSSFVIILQANDDAGNYMNSSSIIIYVDTVKPDIELIAPTNGENINSTSAQFNFTATDNMAAYMICNLTISNGMNQTNINATSTILQTINKSGFVPGTYNWNVTCIDLAGNVNTSETLNFTINAPDLIITSGNITLSASSPEEGQNITLFANITNIGGTVAYNITVQFWLGDPDSGGTQINGNKTIADLDSWGTTTVNVTYNTSIGYNNIFVVVDPPTATNGSIVEGNESNNKANNTFTVSLYQVYSGNITAMIYLEKQSINESIYTWNVANATGGNIFVADIESAINFNSLQAIAQNTLNATVFNDFANIDTALGTTNYSDSINITYTLDGAAKVLKTFDVFNGNINNVPIVNSTNVSSFVTGILWDTSDGNREYNGTQDIVFITEINKSQVGGNGEICDFEIKVPALLRNYDGAGTSVAFYYELK
ncbi:hypothetical protein JW756_05875 [Candidatus Woesearchaeota archaeon]|nr:hypothetical protein [Candidatus Woesearchaeota archaeon]